MLWTIALSLSLSFSHTLSASLSLSSLLSQMVPLDQLKVLTKCTKYSSRPKTAKKNNFERSFIKRFPNCGFFYQLMFISLLQTNVFQILNQQAAPLSPSGPKATLVFGNWVSVDGNNKNKLFRN